MEKLKKWISNFFNAFKVSGIPFLIGFLGSFAGSEGTSLLWRRCGIPLIFTICALFEIQHISCIFLMSIWGWLSLGYGEDSFLRKLYNGNNYLTRGTIGLGISLSFLVIPILKGNWMFYFLGSLGIILVYAFNSWRGYGQFIIKSKNKIYYLLKVDFVTYSVLGICGLIMIYKG